MSAAPAPRDTADGKAQDQLAQPTRERGTSKLIESLRSSFDKPTEPARTSAAAPTTPADFPSPGRRTSLKDVVSKFAAAEEHASHSTSAGPSSSPTTPSDFPSPGRRTSLKDLVSKFADESSSEPGHVRKSSTERLSLSRGASGEAAGGEHRRTSSKEKIEFTPGEHRRSASKDKLPPVSRSSGAGTSSDSLLTAVKIEPVKESPHDVVGLDASTRQALVEKFSAPVKVHTSEAPSDIVKIDASSKKALLDKFSTEKKHESHAPSDIVALDPSAKKSILEKFTTPEKTVTSSEKEAAKDVVGLDASSKKAIFEKFTAPEKVASSVEKDHKDVVALDPSSKKAILDKFTAPEKIVTIEKDHKDVVALDPSSKKAILDKFTGPEKVITSADKDHKDVVMLDASSKKAILEKFTAPEKVVTSTEKSHADLVTLDASAKKAIMEKFTSPATTTSSREKDIAHSELGDLSHIKTRGAAFSVASSKPTISTAPSSKEDSMFTDIPTRGASKTVSASKTPSKDASAKSAPKYTPMEVQVDSSFEDSLPITKKSVAERAKEMKTPIGLATFTPLKHVDSAKLHDEKKSEEKIIETPSSPKLLELNRPVIAAGRRRARTKAPSIVALESSTKLETRVPEKRKEERKSTDSLESGGVSFSPLRKPHGEAKMEVEDDFSSSRFRSVTDIDQRTFVKSGTSASKAGVEVIKTEYLAKFDEKIVEISDSSKVNKWTKAWKEERITALKTEVDTLNSKTILAAQTAKEIAADEVRDSKIMSTVLRKKVAVDMEAKLLFSEDYAKDWLSSFTRQLDYKEGWADDGTSDPKLTDPEYAIEINGLEDVLGKYAVHEERRTEMMKKLAQAVAKWEAPGPVTVLRLYTDALDDYFLEELLHEASLGKLSKVRVLNLESNFLEEKSLVMLARALEESATAAVPIFPELRELRLENQRKDISSAVEAAFESCLKANKTLTKLGMRIRNEGIKVKIYELLLKNRDTVRDKRLEKRRSRGEIPIIEPKSDLQKMIARVAANDPEVKEFIVQGDRMWLALKKEEMLDFAKSLAKNTHLVKLQLTNIDLDKQFAEVLSESLKENMTLEEVNLENNMINGDGIVALCECLRFNVTLKKFLLGSQSGSVRGVSTESEATILDILAGNKSVRKLGIQMKILANVEKMERLLMRNVEEARKSRASTSSFSSDSSRLGSPVGSPLGSPSISMPKTLSADGLPRRSTLMTSEMEVKVNKFISGEEDKTETFEVVEDRFFNSLKDETKLAFLRSLASNKTLKVLKIISGGLTDAMAEALAKSLSTNGTLEEINLERNALTTKGLEFIVESLRTNTTLKKVFLDHQKTGGLSSAAEGLVAEVMEVNKTISKLGLQFRTLAVRDKVDRAIRRNHEIARTSRK